MVPHSSAHLVDAEHEPLDVVPVTQRHDIEGLVLGVNEMGG